MKKELSSFQETMRVIIARLERASSVAEVEAIRQHVRVFRADLVYKGRGDTPAADQAKKAERLCSARLNELREKELADLFK